MTDAFKGWILITAIFELIRLVQLFMLILATPSLDKPLDPEKPQHRINIHFY